VPSGRGRAPDLLYVGTFPPHPGGSAVTGQLILRGLAARGWRIRVLSPIAAAEADPDRFQRAAPDLELTRFPLPYPEVSPDIPQPEDYRRLERQQVEQLLTRLIRERRPDLVLAGRESFAWYVPEIARRHGLPWAVRIAGGTTAGILNGSYPAELAAGLIERLASASLVCAPARHVAESLALLGLPAVEVIPNPVDTSRFRPGPRDEELARELSIDRDDVVVAHISNFKALKRPLDLVESAVRALRRDRRLLYLVVGDGTLHAEFVAAAERGGVAHRFRFVGWVDHEAVPDYIRLADIVVMPSAAEAQARVYLETQACARTLVASDIPGAREVVVDGETGLLFRTGEVEDLTAKVLLAAGDRGLRERLGRQGRQRLAPHLFPRVVAAYDTQFSRLLDSRLTAVDSSRSARAED
jgi:glycosyltransferase involved in cell wall biosynthesis